MSRTTYAVGMGLLLIASAIVAGAGSAVAADSTARNAVEGAQDQETTTTTTAQTQGSLNLSQLNVTAYEAAVLAQNETNGTVLGVRLKTVNGTPGYEVLVANETGNVTGVVVNAEQAEVIETQQNIARLNQTIFQQQGVDVSNLTGAVETIQTAQQEVGDQFVPIEVSIEAQPGFLGQQITFVSPNATKSVVVDLSNNTVVAVSEEVPTRGADGANATTETAIGETTAAGETQTTTEMAMVDASAANAAQDDGNQGCCVGDDELTREFGEASNYVATTADDYGDAFADQDDGFFASDDEFDTADNYGAFAGNENEEDDGLFGGGEEEEEAEGGFLGEEDEDGWF
ncbi:MULTISPECIES: PepSY domain-containing protein [Halorussus]|uniref:PepSY domain-containing protein n=1 Tax=Halorussus TaxID=1070314 RepID=UPI0020A0ACEC|nr:hypothetical protein [Halorussus vallis]USZ78068.1 hypothetical protein NGM07_20615 [Halorussus vallis]